MKTIYLFIHIFLNGPYPAIFFFFSSFQYTVDSKQMFNINTFLPMTGFEPRTSGIRGNRSTNWATPLPLRHTFYLLQKVYLEKSCLGNKLID